MSLLLSWRQPILFATALFLPLSAFGTVWNSPTGNQSDVQNTINGASAGDTVTVPSGSYTWAPSLTISKAITLIAGYPSGTTTITLSGGTMYGNAVIAIQAAATVSGFTIAENSSNTVAFQTNANGFTIKNITYTQGSSTSGPYFAFVQNYGLITGCSITGNNGSAELIEGEGANSTSWQTPDSLGTANATYIENCTFNGSGYVCDFGYGARAVVRFCTINGQMKVDGHGYASDNPGRGVRQMEVYCNTWTYNQNAYYNMLEWRGGTGMFFNNTVAIPGSTGGVAWDFFHDYAYLVSSSAGTTPPYPHYAINISSVSSGSPFTVTTAMPHQLPVGKTIPYIYIVCSASGLNGFYTVTTTGANTFSISGAGIPSSGSGTVNYEFGPAQYPLPDQVGVGMDAGGPFTGASDPVYVWGNTYGSGALTRSLGVGDATSAAVYEAEIGSPGYSFTDNDVIKEGRDIFSDTVGNDVTVGTLENRPSSGSAVGVGYWATDQGIWNKSGLSGTLGQQGQLYVWSGSVWVLKYTPFTYPFPPDLPITPSNLSISSP